MKEFLQTLTTAEKFACCVAADDAAWHEAEFVALWQTLGEEAAWAVADEHDLTSLAGALLERWPVPAAPKRWAAAAHSVRGRLALYLAELDRVAARFAGDGIPLVALKNSGIARGLYPDPAGCPMGDIDVMVSPRDFRRAHGLMQELGYELADRSPFELLDIEEAERHGGSEYTCRLTDGSTLWFELQWRPVSGRWLQPDQEPKADDLLSRSEAVPDTAARLLVPEDNLLQVCLHTAKHSYVRAPGFRLHTDVDRIVRRCTIDWERFAAEVERLQVRTAVYFSLLLPAELLRTPVPQAVLARLRPPAWKERAISHSLTRAGIFHPTKRKWSKAGYIGFNLLLYDTPIGVWRAVFPDRAWMEERYGVTSRWTLPWGHVRRIAELLLKRAKT